MGYIKKITSLISVLILLQIMNIILIQVANKVSVLINYSDPKKSILLAIIQQVLMLVLAIIIFKVFIKRNIGDLGFNLNDKKLSLKIFSKFAILWLIIILVYCIVIYFFCKEQWASILNTPVPKTDYIISYLSFETILPGLCEEALFRGVVIYLLTNSGWIGRFKLWKLEIPSVALLSGILFMLAHIYFKFSPFEIIHLNYSQAMMALFLGMFQAIVFIKTKSLLCPILVHNYSNVTVTISGYLISFIGNHI